ncbi:Flp family type IVb pilin [Cognatishimia maritima]|uniref:Flp pilus assembly protein, pilin Flp n=1 Tax=Cognatishimia maritima TaxID=870908 RepID=A0A1M5S2J1_9RHOB|nr:hypothetical protein [Cognatishimia maritima]SHH32862.1 Flp pilus assembly protein, pilin Flp [Cognatishimia maritima]
MPVQRLKTFCRAIARSRFADDESGVAIVEYLILLGLIAGSVIVAISIFGESMGVTWENWAAWAEDMASRVPGAS